MEDVNLLHVVLAIRGALPGMGLTDEPALPEVWRPFLAG